MEKEESASALPLFLLPLQGIPRCILGVPCLI